MRMPTYHGKEDEFFIYEKYYPIELSDGGTLTANNGVVVGFKPNTPQWVKDEYESRIRAQENAKRKGVKI